MIEANERPDALVCMEVWGGNRSVMRAIELSGLTVWVYSNVAGAEDASGGGGGGDVYYISLCGQAILSRVALADVSGHGAEVSAPAQVLMCSRIKA